MKSREWRWFARFKEALICNSELKSMNVDRMCIFPSDVLRLMVVWWLLRSVLMACLSSWYATNGHIFSKDVHAPSYRFSVYTCDACSFWPLQYSHHSIASSQRNSQRFGPFCHFQSVLNKTFLTIMTHEDEDDTKTSTSESMKSQITDNELSASMQTIVAWSELV